MRHFSVLRGAAGRGSGIKEKPARNYYDMEKALALLNVTPTHRVFFKVEKTNPEEVKWERY